MSEVDRHYPDVDPDDVDPDDWRPDADEYQDDARERFGFGVCGRRTCVEPCGPNGGCIR